LPKTLRRRFASGFFEVIWSVMVIEKMKGQPYFIGIMICLCVDGEKIKESMINCGVIPKEGEEYVLPPDIDD
jgi:hypothetical protein